jgi:hypothetical protein
MAAPWHAEARRRREQGWTVQAIADHVGRSKSTVGYFLTPPRCVCGASKGNGSKRCLGCHQAVTEVRESLVEGMWADGWSIEQISQALGRTYVRGGRSVGIAALLHRLRAQDRLPYRYAA